MIIEINKDIDKYQEGIILGLTAKQLFFSAASIVVGGGIVFGLYKYIGLTASAYIAVPFTAPIAMGGFYSFHGMSFYEVVKRRMGQIFFYPALVYASSKNEGEIKAYRKEMQEIQRVQQRKNKTGKRKSERG